MFLKLKKIIFLLIIYLIRMQVLHQKTDKKVEKKFARGGNEGFTEYKR